MADPSLTHGDGWLMCQICWEYHVKPFPDLFVDARGYKWNICKGKCAVESGLAHGPHLPGSYKAA